MPVCVCRERRADLALLMGDTIQYVPQAHSSCAGTLRPSTAAVADGSTLFLRRNLARCSVCRTHGATCGTLQRGDKSSAVTVEAIDACVFKLRLFD
jgi:hypothetical protein